MDRRVLVVDDNRSINNQVADMLGRRGFHCLQAFDGLEALKCFTDCLPDALVLDLNLPKIHGLEVLRYVKQESPQTAVVVLTGHGSEQTAVRALHLGADDYLVKPLAEEALAESLRRTLERSDRERRADGGGTARGALSDRKISRLFFGAPAALALVDTRGVVQVANRAAARLLGRGLDELIGTPLAALLAESVRSTWLTAVRAEVRDGRSCEGEVFFVGSAGEPIPIGFTVVEAVDGDGLLVSLRDMARQKSLEKQFLESKRLSSLGRVVEGVAHEVRNPVIAIGGFARKLLRDTDGPDPRRQHLEVILAEAQRLERMVREIEQYVEFSASHRSQFTPVDLSPLVLGVLERAKSLGPCRGIRFEIDAPQDLPALFGDSALLSELLDGLVENACDAMDDGGVLSVSLAAEGNWLRLRISDTGAGIPEKDLEAIFDPFFTTKTSGVGLGLAKAHMIVEEHSGMIDFESQLGRGTVCTVTLPLDRRRIPRWDR